MIAIDNDEVLLLMLKEMYVQERIHCDTCTNAAELMEMIRPERIQSASDRFEYAGYKRLRAVGTATHLQCGQFKDHSNYRNNRFG
ncbi:hypothetical protein [Phocaeicola sartorii]|uniref:hypothetical protein n=1 Tax=Phocaeicola sartorii TaxID=671267 RepID=UPI003F68C848